MSEPARHEDPQPDTITDPDARRVVSENLNVPQAPWGVDEDSPKDEGSEATTAVTEARRGERRAGAPPEEPPERQSILTTAEPTRTPEAGPGVPEPAPPRRTFPDPESIDGNPQIDR